MYTFTTIDEKGDNLYDSLILRESYIFRTFKWFFISDTYSEKSSQIVIDHKLTILLYLLYV